MPDYRAAVSRYVRMRLTKSTVRELASRTRIPRATLHDMLLGKCRRALDYVAALEYWLKCPLDVILGRQPCLKKCPYCEQAQP